MVCFTFVKPLNSLVDEDIGALGSKTTVSSSVLNKYQPAKLAFSNDNSNGRLSLYTEGNDGAAVAPVSIDLADIFLRTHCSQNYASF